METNTNTPEAKQHASEGCHPTTFPAIAIHFDSPNALLEALCAKQYGAFPIYDKTQKLCPKIIQLLMTPNDASWQGVLLGLCDDGVTYHSRDGHWVPYIPPLPNDSGDARRDGSPNQQGG